MNSQTVHRGVDQLTPILFNFPVASLSNAAFTKVLRIDGGASQNIAGAVTYLHTTDGDHWYRLAYNASDRPASYSTGIVQYAISASGFSIEIDLIVAQECIDQESASTPVVAIPTGQPDVRAAAADPSSITVDGVTVMNRSVAETIAADRHVAGQNAAAKNNNFGIALRRILPGSSVGQ